jgi:hypothetical protein
MTAYETQLAHLIKLASNPATKEHSWWKAKELERCETGMWNGIAQELKEHMKAQQTASLPAPRKRGR